MTLDEIEASVSDGRPYFLYLFREGAEAWRFTSRESDWLSPPGAADGGGAPQLWAARPIAHERVRQSGDASRVDMKIAMPRSDVFARRYLGPRDNQQTTVTVYRGHEQLPSVTAVYWKGRVTAAALDGERIELRCESLLTTLQREGLPARFARLCRHAHYGRGCRLVLADHLVAATATAITGRTVTVTEAAGEADGHYTAGILQFEGLSGFIARHEGTALELLDPAPSLAAALAGGAQSVSIAPGCDLRLSTCQDKFSNTLNFGGFPDIPSQNYFDGLSLV